MIGLICQVYDMTWQIKPITSNYKVLTKNSLPTFAAAVDAKSKIAKQANCLI